MTSPRLGRTIIADLVQQFFGATEDQKRGIVDSLGLHPANHAEFVYQFARYHGDARNIAYAYAYLEYCDLVRPAIDGFIARCENSSDPLVKI